MPIKVTCACGQSFAAKDELAGKTVKCPKCAQPLKIPSPAAATAQARAPAVAAAATPMSSMNSLFDDVGVRAAAPAGATLCPGCAQPLSPDVVLCIKCGYNVKLGRRMQTMSSSKAAGGGASDPHGGAAATLLARAAEAIDDAEAEEKKKTGEGLPWWAYLIAMCSVVGFMVMMMTLPMEYAFTAAGGLLLLAGFLVSVYSGIRLIIIAFQEGALQGILYLLIGPYQIYYVFTRWENCGGFFLMNLAGGGIMGAGLGMFWLAGIAASWKEEDPNAMLPLPRPPAIVLIAEASDGFPVARAALVHST